MPVIVVGADTPVGWAIVSAMVEPDREVRAFVSSPAASERLKRLGVKVALGDVSDVSHVEGACLHCFSAVLIGEAAFDDRERSFAPDAAAVLAGWAEAVRRVQRVIWVGVDDPPATPVDEVARVQVFPDPAMTAVRVAELDGYDSDHFRRALSGDGPPLPG
jgi:nucleoside-diphosphate-sugar epimerase